MILCAFGALHVQAQEEEPAPPDSPVLEEMEDAEGEETLTIPEIPLMERFEQGGLTMYVLLVLSVIMVTFGTERLFNLRRQTIVPAGLADEARKVWDRNDTQKVIELAEKNPSVLASAIELLAKHPDVSRREISEMAGDEISRVMRRHLQRAYPLAIVATLAPLLGLLGTVTGMIDAFEVVAIAGSLGDASLLAAGIAKALVTTAFGLIVAIPSLGLYHHFRGKTHEFALQVEEEADELISEWFRPQPLSGEQSS